MKPEQLTAEILQQIIQLEIDISYSNCITVKCIEENMWKVEYEEYFNPHGNPKQLMGYKLFNNSLDVANFFLNYVSHKM
jgi:hypothetical protein